MSCLPSFVLLREALFYEKALSLSNRTDFKNGFVHYATADFLVFLQPQSFEIFTGPDGQRMIRRKTHVH